MKRIAGIILVSLCALALAGFANATTYFVSPQGDDAKPGTTPAGAWRTIGRVNAATLNPGDIVRLKAGGVWRETLLPNKGGSPGHPITFTSYGSGAQPVISGADVVSGWLPDFGAVYRARSAQAGSVFMDEQPGWGLSHACCLPGERCEIVKPCSIGPMMEGSWYWNSGTLFLWLPAGAKPTHHLIEASTRDAGMKVLADSGEKSNIVVDGLKFERTSGWGIYFFSNARNHVGLTGIVVRNCTVTQTGTGPVDDGSYRNGIHYSQQIELPTAPIFENNRISYTGNHGNGINSQNADGAKLIGNEVTHFNHHGLDTKHSADVTVRANIVHDSYGNGIYQEYCANGLIENNAVYNMSGTMPGRASGIQIDVGTSGARIFHNSIYNVLSGVYLTTAASVEYNAIAGTRGSAIEAIAGGLFDHNVLGPTQEILMDHRRYTVETWLAERKNGSVAADPMWIDPADGNFATAPNSPCREIGAGIAIQLSPSLPP
jgi:parallel beta-helix repeat protein